MNMDLKPLPLDADWHFFPTIDMDAAYGTSMLDESSWDTLPSLTDWPRDLLHQHGILHLRHTVYLHATESCVRYLLVLTEAPEQTEVFVNGWHVGTTRAGEIFRANVTDQVVLESNVILLKVRRAGAFGRAHLQPVPCE